MDLNFIEEEVPRITRPGGSGREAEPWEKHIAPLKAEDKAGKSFRVWTYEKRPSAVSRMSSVRERLTKAVPHENWQLSVRAVPGVESQFGVYVSYEGTFTNEQVVENAQKRNQRSERVKAARAAKQVEPTATEPVGATAKERVAAAAKGKSAA